MINESTALGQEVFNSSFHMPYDSVYVSFKSDRRTLHSVDLLNMTVKVLQIIGDASFISKRDLPSSEDDIVLMTSTILPGGFSLS